jgi:hypothetical protein
LFFCSGNRGGGDAPHSKLIGAFGLLIAYEFRDMRHEKCMFFMAAYFILDHLAERRSRQISQKEEGQATCKTLPILYDYVKIG